MISAAVVSSRRVPSTRPRKPREVRTRGITETPVSKPDRPSASLGNTSAATATAAQGEECWLSAACHHCANPISCERAICHQPTASTTALRLRYTGTRTTATLMASENPAMNTAPSSRSSPTVTQNCQ